MRPSTRQDWFAATAVLAALVAVFAIPAATTGASLARAVAAMAIGALIALAVGRAPFTFAVRVRTGFVLLVALALWYAVTRFWAVAPAGSMFEAARVSAFVLVVWAVHTCVTGTAARRALLAGIAGCGIYVSLPPLWDTLTDGAPRVRVAGELGYWNATAAVALVLVPTAVALAGTGRRALIVLGAALIPIAGVTATASASRGALAALAIALLVQALLDPDHRGGLPRAIVAGVALGLTIGGLAINDMPVVVALLAPALVAIGGFGLIRARRIRREERARLAAVPDHPPTPEGGDDELPDGRDPAAVRRTLVRVTGALLIAAMVALLAALVLDANDGNLPGPGSGTSASGDVTRLASTDDSARLDWYREGLDFWKQRPIVGQGGGAFAALHVEGRGANLDHVHSMPLEVLLETGVVGLLLLAAGTVLLLRVLRQGRRSTERALAGAICALILLQATIDWTLSLPQLVMLLAIAGPIALTTPPDPDDPVEAGAATAPGQVPTWAAITMLGALAVATTVALTPVLATLLADQAASAIDDGNPQRAAELSDQSMYLVPSLETLYVQVIALQAMGDATGARAALRDNEQVWLHSLDGLQLAEPLLGDDPRYRDEIADRMRRMQALQDSRTIGGT